MATQTKVCDACGVSVTYTGHRGFGAAHANCTKRGADASDAEHPACPVHRTLVWTVGPYSTFRQCASGYTCTAGKRGKPYRICAPRGESDTSDTTNSDTSNDEDDDIMAKSTPITEASTPDVQSALAQLVAALQPKAPAVDMDDVQAMIDAAVDAKLQTTVKTMLVIERKEPAATVEIEHPHPYLSRVVRLVDAGLSVYLWGPAGGGKTTAAQQVAKALGREFEIDTLDPSTFRSMVQGFQTPDGRPVHTSFTRCYTDGKVYCADENDLGPGHVQTLYNSALANGHAPFAWGNIARNPSFAYIGTGNTPGMPTREFPDRKPMSAAFKDRLYFVYWPLDEQAERAWSGVGGNAKSQVPTVAPRKCTAEQWVNFVQALRDWARTNAPTLMITPRASLVGLKALACGEAPEQVADGLIFRGADAEIRTKALNAVRLP